MAGKFRSSSTLSRAVAIVLGVLCVNFVIVISAFLVQPDIRMETLRPVAMVSLGRGSRRHRDRRRGRSGTSPRASCEPASWQHGTSAPRTVQAVAVGRGGFGAECRGFPAGACRPVAAAVASRRRFPRRSRQSEPASPRSTDPPSRAGGTARQTPRLRLGEALGIDRLAASPGPVLGRAVVPDAADRTVSQKSTGRAGAGPVLGAGNEVFLAALGKQVAKTGDLRLGLEAHRDRPVPTAPGLLTPAVHPAGLARDVGVEVVHERGESAGGLGA